MKMRKTIIFVMVICLLSLAACGDVPPDFEEKILNDYAVDAYAQYEIINSALRCGDGRLAEKSTLSSVATLWTYGAYFTATASLMKVHKTDAMLDYAKSAIKELQLYKCKDKDAYASNNGEERPVFFDDNVWLVLGLLDFYESTEDADFLSEAESVQSFIYTGWQESLGGGLLWREFSPDTAPEKYVRNTCINAPAIVASAKLYNVTGKTEYLQWAKKIYTWTKSTLKNNDLGTYFDCIDKNGKIDYAQFTYNSGCMLSAASLLYEITGEDEYAAEATSIAEASYALFAQTRPGVPDGGDFYYDNPWFNVYLFYGYYDAYRVFGDEYKGYLERLKKGYDFAVERRLYDKRGLLYDRWDGSEKRSDDEKVSTLNALGNVECITVLSRYQALTEA